MRLAAASYRFLAILWRKRYYFIFPILLLPLAGFFIASSVPIKYTAKTTILLQESALINPVLVDLSLRYNLTERFKALRVLLRSRELLLSIAEKSDVIATDDPIWKRLWYTSKIKQNLVITRAGSELVKLSMQWHDPDELERLVSLLSAAFIQRLTKPNLESRLSASSFLENQIQRQNKQLKQTEKSLISYQEKYLSKFPLLFINRTDIRAEMIEQLQIKQQQLFDNQIQIAIIHQEFSKIDPKTLVISNILKQRQQEELLLSNRYTTKHSKVVSINNEIKLLQQQINNRDQLAKNMNAEPLWLKIAHIAKIYNIPASQLNNITQYQILGDDIARLGNQIKTLQNQIYKHDQDNTKYISLEYNLNALVDSIDQQRVILSDLQSRYEMSKVSKALGEFERIDAVRVIQAPIYTSKNAALSPFIHVIFGLLLALIQTMLLCVIMRKTQDRIWFASDIASLTNIPIICSIPSFNTFSQTD